MDGPIITRDGDGNIKKHWTMESAEAADRAARERLAEKILATRTVRPTLCQRLVDTIDRVLLPWRDRQSKIGNRKSKIPHAERL